MRIPASDVKAFIWIKANLPKNAIIQPSPIYNYSLSKELYSQAPYLLIPSLAERSVICCTHGTLKAFGIDHRDISEKMRQLHHMFATRNVSEAISLLKTYKIDYVYIGTNEQALYSEEGLRKFENKTFFSKIFFNEKVKIYKVI
jgi:FMN phosphatase YigB (HAD superfamily)